MRSWTFTNRPASSINERKSAIAATTAVAMANPLVKALVVLPIWSNLATMRPACVSPCSTPDISKIPFALSTIGPNVSSARIKPVVVSRPNPARAIPYAASATLPPKI